MRPDNGLNRHIFKATVLKMFKGLREDMESAQQCMNKMEMHKEIKYIKINKT